MTKQLTKQQYELIASVIKSAFDYYGEDEIVVKRIAESLCGTFAAFDPRFKRDQFLKDCGVTD